MGLGFEQSSDVERPLQHRQIRYDSEGDDRRREQQIRYEQTSGQDNHSLRPLEDPNLTVDAQALCSGACVADKERANERGCARDHEAGLLQCGKAHE